MIAGTKEPRWTVKQICEMFDMTMPHLNGWIYSGIIKSCEGGWCRGRRDLLFDPREILIIDVLVELQKQAVEEGIPGLANHKTMREIGEFLRSKTLIHIVDQVAKGNELLVHGSGQTRLMSMQGFAFNRSGKTQMLITVNLRKRMLAHMKGKA